MKDICNIAVTIQNLVQFYSLQKGIDALISKDYTVDIYVPINNDDSGIGDMFNETYEALFKLGYTPMRNLDSTKHYKILLEPYPMDIYYKFNFQYRLKYKYAPIAAKPNLTCNPENNIFYDAIFCYGSYEANYLKAYSNTYIIGNLKYMDFHRAPVFRKNKPVLLYLPTYGPSSSIDNIIDSLKLLKNDYYIVTKFHHGTSYLHYEKTRIEKLKCISDEYYDHSTQLIDLLAKAHVVLSDNSGSIFESLYAGVPVAIFSDNLNDNKLENFNTTQFEIVSKGYIPYTNNTSEISKILKEAISEEYIRKQETLKEVLFHDSQNPVKDFIEVIELYMNDNIDTKYKAIHDILIKNYQDKINLINNLNTIITEKNKELEALKTNSEKILSQKDKIISYYENGKLYKLSNKFYRTYHKLIGKGGNYE